MVMFPRRMYPNSSQEYLDDMKEVEGSFLNDDLMNSYYGHKNNVKFYLVNNPKLDAFTETKQEGMLTGTNTPGKYYYKMVKKGQVPFPYLYLVILILLVFVLYKLSRVMLSR